ncbi:TCR/Tet family MFS transporter [Candidatus Halocynthiibacter alkanivorans]|uniref:TCR/Tet family MFS transporter n=1 Tax=Candidatus Halocynthiibacter alkanivorans TaxID=2267619 RepID=UPI000DF3CDFD|nr:TCR/Tet family MFS transporter [Candidatus Halocynthiibacter alkanivorans]
MKSLGPARTFIMMTVVLDAMGIGLIMPVMPSLLREIEGASLADAAIWGGVMSMVFAVNQFLFGPLIGNLSDRFGRRPVLLLSLVVMALDYLVMAVTGSILLLLLMRFIGGITAATHSTANAFMADISAPEDKAANFGLIGAAFGIGFILGPVLGGVLGEFGTRAPFYAAAALAGGNAVFGYLVLPETVTDAMRRPFKWSRANPFGALQMIRELTGVSRLMLLYFINQVAFFVYPAIWSYFTIARFGWSEGMIGLSLGAFGLSMALVQGVLMRPVVKRLGEMRTMYVALLFNLVAFLLMAVVSNGWIAMALTPLTALGSMASPAMQGVMSRATPDDQQGALQGAISSAAALATILSPLAMTWVFARFTRAPEEIYQPGAPFMVAAVLTLLCLVLAQRLRARTLQPQA